MGVGILNNKYSPTADFGAAHPQGQNSCQCKYNLYNVVVLGLSILQFNSLPHTGKFHLSTLTANTT